jgi:hypothetical protein
MKRMTTLLALSALLIFGGFTAAQAVKLRIVFGGPTVTRFVYVPGTLTLGVLEGFTVVRSEAHDNDLLVVYHANRKAILRAYDARLKEIGFKRDAATEDRKNLTVVYQRDDDKIRLKLERSGQDWGVRISVF